MRSLIQLLINYHRLVLFVALELIALSWVSSTHANPRGKLTEIGLEFSSSWFNAVGRLAHLSTLKENNTSLLIENSRLRTENLAIKSSWESVPSEIIRFTSTNTNNILIANSGRCDGVNPGMGMIEGGCIAGLVVEATDNESLILPIIHTKTQWSVRLGEYGAVGRLIWDGKDINYALLYDIPLSEMILPGDSVITSGFGGTFPPGIKVGKVEEVLVTSADRFKTVKVKLGADFSRIHYVEFLSNPESSSLDSLITLAPEL